MSTTVDIRPLTPLAVLLNPQSDAPLTELEIRREDYLNDKIQTNADLDGIEDLIASVEARKRQLKAQLEDAVQKLAQANDDYSNRNMSILQQGQEFERQLATVQARLVDVTFSTTPEDAVQRLQKPSEKLRKLEIAERYVEMLEHIENLMALSRSHLPQDPKEALKPYAELKALAFELQTLQDPAEGAAVHLINYAQTASTNLWAEMKRIMTTEFELVLKESKWPDSASVPSREWTDSFERLLDLQAPEIMTAREPLILLPMSVLAKPFIQQFRFHFFSDKPTNHPHQLGSYFFEWFLGTIVKWEGFLETNIGPILAAHFRGNILAGNTLYVDPVSAFITALLPILKEKVDNLVCKISSEPQFLSRFMAQLMNFDEALRSRFNFDGGNAEYGWKGLTWGVLDSWYHQWQGIEKEFAIRRYQEIMNASDCKQIDYDSSAPGKTKSTYGASQVTDLMLTVTLQYKKLRRFSHKFGFLKEIQAKILDDYVGRLNTSLSDYQTYTTILGRKVHTITKEDKAALDRLGGLESLCEIYVSAEHLISALKEWSNEEFFVDMWEQLQDRASNVTNNEESIVGAMTLSDVKENTSDAVGSKNEGSVFDITIKDFDSVRNKAEISIIKILKVDYTANLSPYFHKPEWQTIDDTPLSSIALGTVTPELDQPLQILKRCLTFLHKSLSAATFKRFSRELVAGIENAIFNNVLLRQEFSTLGASRFMQDVNAIQSVFDSYFPHGTPLRMPKLKEAAALLNLSIEAEENRMPLKDTYALLNTSNAAAKEVLENLGMHHLTNNDAREILARRLETGRE